MSLAGARARAVIKRALNSRGIEINRHPWFRRLNAVIHSAQLHTVIDVGANEGQFAKSLRMAGYDGTIVSVEPIAEAFSRLSRAARDDSAWHVVKAAVGDQIGDAEINVSRNSVSSSLLPMEASHVEAAPDSVYERREAVRLTTIDNIVIERELSPSDALLKIDVQGYEAKVLAGAGDALSSIAGVLIEMSTVELYTGQMLLRDTIDLLDRYGLSLWALDPGFSSPENGRMLQCDGLFIRN